MLGHFDSGVWRRCCWLWLGVAWRTVGVLGVVVVFAGCGSSSRSATASAGAQASAAVGVAASAVALTRRVDALLGGVPQDGDVLGRSSAPLTLVYFGDLDCSNSREFVMGPLATIIREWVRKGRLRVVYRSLYEGSESRVTFARQQAALLAAGLQGKLWRYLVYFYSTQEEGLSGEADACDVAESFPARVAARVPGLDLARWARERYDGSLEREVAADQRLAARLGFRSTPSLLIGRTGSRLARKLDGFLPTHHPAFTHAIERLLEQAARS